MLHRIKKFVDYIAFRTSKRYNIIKIRDLPPNYYDKDTILLHAVMQLVVDFVEIECAFIDLDEPYTLKQRINFRLPWFLRSDEVYRNRESGLNHLKMLEETYDDMLKTNGDAPRAIREVYLWWKDVRPNRQEVEEESGFTDFMKNCEDLDSEKNQKKLTRILKKSIKLEERNHREDTAMLNKVIKHRSFMWT